MFLSVNAVQFATHIVLTLLRRHCFYFFTMGWLALRSIGLLLEAAATWSGSRVRYVSSGKSVAFFFVFGRLAILVPAGRLNVSCSP